MFIDGKERTAVLGQGGYKYFWISDGTSIKEHRAVMEQMIGRKLEPGEEVHHIDGDRANNNPSNLMLLTKSEHSRLHRLKDLERNKLPFGASNIEKRKKVVGINKAGEVLRFNSFREARLAGFSHAHDCCKGRRKTDKGYSWRYDNDDKQ